MPALGDRPQPLGAGHKADIVARGGREHRQMQFAEHVAAALEVLLRQALRRSPGQAALPAQTEPPQQRRQVGQHHERRAVRQVVEDRAEQTPLRRRVAALLQFAHRAMPMQVSPQQPVRRIAGQPGVEKGESLVGSIEFEPAVQHDVRVVRIGRARGQGLLCHREALGDVPGFDVRQPRLASSQGQSRG